MKFFIPLFLIAAALPRPVFADAYRDMAKKLSKAHKKIEGTVAVLQFESKGLSGEAAQNAADFVAERLTSELVDIGDLQLVERNLLNKVLSEGKLQTTGAFDKKTLGEIGQLTGAKAVVIGTILDVEDSRKAEVNVRLINVESAAILKTAREVVKKDWQRKERRRSAYRGASSRRSRASRSRSDGFFFVEFLVGASSAKTDLEYSNTNSNISDTDVGFSFTGLPTPFRSFELKDLENGSGVPIGLRLGYQGDVLGGQLEFSTFKHANEKQSNIDGTVNSSNGRFNLVADYLEVSVLNLLVGDLLIRFPTGEDLIPYLGIGGGMTLTSIKSPFVKAFEGDGSGTFATPWEQTVPGLTLRIPVGLRARLSDRVGLMVEGRYFRNATIGLDRNIKGEDDQVTLSGFQGLFGLTLFF